jgi:hypothetical protein
MVAVHQISVKRDNLLRLVGTMKGVFLLRSNDSRSSTVFRQS